MSTTVEGHYEGVRFSPSLNRAQPFQILGFLEDWQGNVVSSIVTSMNIEQAKDLHRSLGMLIKGADSV
jgi:hypothetical protein